MHSPANQPPFPEPPTLLRFADRAATAGGEFSPAIRVAVGVPAEAPWNEVAGMIVETLMRLGVEATTVQDGDELAFEQDMLLLVGSGRWFPEFRELGQRLRHRRPRVVLWHLQPLPPPMFTHRAHELGKKMLRAQWDDLFGQWFQPLNHLVPVRGHGRLLVQRALGVQVLQEFERIGGPDYGNVGWEDLHMLFEEAAWFTETWSHPEPWIDEIATDTSTRATFLRQNGIPARFVPLGYHAQWGSASPRERDLDVLFIGDIRSPSREELVPEVLQQLRDWGFSTSERAVFPEGAERAELLQRARVVLNVLRLPWEFPGVRLFSSVACGALVVSNEAVQNEPFQAGLHFVPAPRKRMAEAIATLLDHEEDRAQRAARALASMKPDLSLELSLQRLLQPRREQGTTTSFTARAA